MLVQYEKLTLNLLLTSDFTIHGQTLLKGSLLQNLFALLHTYHLFERMYGKFKVLFLKISSLSQFRYLLT